MSRKEHSTGAGSPASQPRSWWASTTVHRETRSDSGFAGTKSGTEYWKVEFVGYVALPVSRHRKWFGMLKVLASALRVVRVTGRFFASAVRNAAWCKLLGRSRCRGARLIVMLRCESNSWRRSLFLWATADFSETLTPVLGESLAVLEALHTGAARNSVLQLVAGQTPTQ